MKKKIMTPHAPAAIGPYSQAIQYGDLLFISGQIPLDPDTGDLIKGDIKVQTKQVLENLRVILEESGMTVENVLKCSCFLKNLDDFTQFNTIYDAYFRESLPAREAIEVKRLPKDVLIEISAICGR